VQQPLPRPFEAPAGLKPRADKTANGPSPAVSSPATPPRATTAPAPPAPPAVVLRPSQLRSAVALAEAILPGSATIPGADEATVARMVELLGSLSPALSQGWLVAQQALDLAAIGRTGRPFHALSADRQEALIRRWEQDPILKAPLALVATSYKFVHFDRAPVYSAMGGKLNVVKGLEQPGWLRQIHRAADWAEGDDIECDVVVIGTGAGGAVVGRELADRGHAVVFVEEGEHHRRDAFDGSSIRAHQKFYRGAISLGTTVMPVFMGRLVGGSTAINGGTCFRTPPWILDRWCEDLATDELAPERMAPFFDRVEQVLEVAPSPREVIGPIADVVARGCDALGWSHFPVQRNAPGCDGSGFCDFGCRTDARRGTNISYVPPALERGAVLLTGLRAERILVEDGRAVGVEGVAKNGRVLRVRGRAVVLSGGAIPTPLFLMKQGLANRSGQVGKNLSLHPSAGFSALFDDEIRGYKHVPQGYGTDQFLREGILVLAAQADFNFAGMLFTFNGRRLVETLEQFKNIASFGVLIRDSGQNGRVRMDAGGHAIVTYNPTREDVDLMHKALIRTGEMCRAAGAKRLYPSVLGHSFLATDADFERFCKATLSASELALTSYHPLGTCRMGSDPKTSVLGLDHQTHDVPGLYVVDGSSVPSATGVNPQLTIMAMATRAAVGISERLG
jgi:choline dehydrogenase-like flavoprotein